MSIMNNLNLISLQKTKIIETVDRFGLLKERQDIARIYGTDICQQWCFNVPSIIYLDGEAIGTVDAGIAVLTFQGLVHGVHVISFIPTS
jgi:hypothetical protein